MSSVKTPKFRISYPKLFKPEKNEQNGKMQYSCVALFPKGADMAGLQTVVKDAIVKKWGPDKNLWPAKLQLPFKDQGERFQKDRATGRPIIGKDGQPLLQPGHEKGAVFLNLKTEQKPGVVNARVEYITDENELYAGCWCIATVRASAYDVNGNRGVSLYLQNVQKVGDGEPLGTVRVAATDEFAPIQDDDAPMSSANDLFA